MPTTSVLSVFIRVAGSPQIGFGHLRRCWTLASRLQESSSEIQFIAAQPEAAALLQQAGFSTHQEPTPHSIEETIRLLQRTSSPSLCLVDDPQAKSDQLASLNRHAPVLCIDDTCRRFFPVRMVTNGSAGAEGLPYQGIPETRFLLGAPYILLRPEFAQSPNRTTPAEKIRRILLLGGGGESGAVFSQLLQTLFQVMPQVQVAVITGPFGTPPKLDPTWRAQVTVHRNPGNIRSLMLEADLAVSGGGQTAYELAATATPTIGIQMSDNQGINLKGLEAAGALRNCGPFEAKSFPDHFAQSLQDLMNDPGTRRRMGTQGRALVDGHGAHRVAEQIRELAFHE